MSLAPDIVAGVARRLAEHAGLELPAWVVEARTAARLAALEMDPASYVALIATARGAGELAALVEAVRVGESSLFRHRPQIAALVDIVVPALRERGKRTVKVWSAGCATGEEPYTLATVLARAMPNVQLTVVATDVSAEALERARDATYPANEFADVPDEWRDAFVVDGDVLHVKRDIAQLVTFERANLVDAVPPRGCDIVWCRNVLIYFSADARRRVIERLIASLAPGGYLFVGYSETLRDIPQLETQRHGDCVFYAKPEKEITAPGVDAYRTPPYGTQMPPTRRTPPPGAIVVDVERETTNVGVPPPPRASGTTTPAPTSSGKSSSSPSTSRSSPSISTPRSSPSMPRSSPSVSTPRSSPSVSSAPSTPSGKSSPGIAVPPISSGKSSPSIPVSGGSSSPSSPSIPVSGGPSSPSSPSLPVSGGPSSPSSPSIPVSGGSPSASSIPSRVVRITLDGQPRAQDVTAIVADRLATRGIERLVIDLDPAEMLSDDLAPVIRRARAAAMTSGVTIELVATKPGTRRWLSRHGLEDV